MKKIMTMMMMAVVCLIMASCSGNSNSDPKAVADKIAAGETLTEADYTTMIDYCANYAEKAQPYFNTINSGAATDSKEYTDAVNELATMSSEAVYLDAFRKAITDADAAQLGEKNVRKVDELAKYEAFPIADVSDSAMMNPDVVGDIVDMPSNDSNGVIASGDGEVVVAK
ncbi:MAG: hypothetical protein HDS03_00100 [Bacteroides sp.]|nr:hypothetical protein [Bacteroides sp.]MDE7441021.1 hypothetical protein [Muribaculaceae bacterium]